MLPIRAATHRARFGRFSLLTYGISHVIRYHVEGILRETDESVYMWTFGRIKLYKK